MPMYELVIHLTNLGDAISVVRGDELITEKGVKYVRSQIGQAFNGFTWVPRYIWSRW